MLVNLVASTEIRDVHLDDRKRHCLDGVVQGDAGERQARTIDQRAVDGVNVLLQCVDQHAFRVGLRGNQLDVELLPERRQPLVDLI